MVGYETPAVSDANSDLILLAGIESENRGKEGRLTSSDTVADYIEMRSIILVKQICKISLNSKR